MEVESIVILAVDLTIAAISGGGGRLLKTEYAVSKKGQIIMGRNRGGVYADIVIRRITSQKIWICIPFNYKVDIRRAIVEDDCGGDSIKDINASDMDT